MWYDLLTLGILMYAMFRGAMKGVVWQLATIAALLMCFFFSGSLSHVVAPFIRVEEPLNKWIAMLVLYLGFSFVSFGIARVMHEAIENMRIEALDRHLGALLGLIKGAMFSMFLTFFLVTLSHSARESIINSESGYVAAVAIDRLDPVIPGDLHALLEPYLRRMDPRGIEREHREDEYARRQGDDRDDPFVDDDHPDDRRDGLDRRDPDARADDHRRFDDDHRPADRRPGDDGGPYAADRRDDGIRRDPIPDRPRDRRESAFDDSAFDAPRRDRAVVDDDLGPPGDDESHWLSSLPAALDQGLRLLARKAWRATRPEHRGELSRLLSSSTVPDLIRKTLRDWQNGRPASSDAAGFDNGPGLGGPELASDRGPDRDRGPGPDRDRPLPGGPDRDRAPLPGLDSDRGRLGDDRGPLGADRGPTGDRRDERASLERQIVRSLGGLSGGSDRPMAAEDIEAQFNGIPDDVAVNVLRGWRTELRDQKSDPRDVDGTTLVRRIRRELSRAGISIHTLDSATQDRLRGGERR
jgi:uncharacterized membrane protein required for colicin V production